MTAEMNWTNYDRLVADLESLKATPEKFDYSVGYQRDSRDAGCVDCRCRLLMGEPANASGPQYHDGIVRFLGVSNDDAYWLWMSVVDGGTYNWTGLSGINEALRRLAILATRYERPTSQPAFTGDEAAFLQSLIADLSLSLTDGR